MSKALRLSCVLALAAPLFAPSTTCAITHGIADGDAHPAVGALAFRGSRGINAYCSGTLISPTVFLTAAHCDIGLVEVTVSFDERIDNGATLHRGTFVPSPDYSPRQNDPQDLAVVLFDEPVEGIAPARLPAEGAAAALGYGQPFTVVGYGGQERVITRGGWYVPYEDAREQAVASLLAVNPGYLRLSQNAAAGNAGACYGDSGGPNFIGAGAGETNVIGGTTITGDVPCVATNVIQRLDTPASRAFLGRFVLLP